MRIFLSSRRLFQDSHVALFSWYCEYTQTDAYRQTHTDRHAHRQDRHTHTQIDTNRHKQIDAHIDRHTYTEYAIILYKSHIVDESYYTIASIHTRTCNICIHTQCRFLAFLSHNPTHSLTHIHIHTPSLALSLSHAPTHTYTHKRGHTQSLSISHAHTYKHTQTHPCTHRYLPNKESICAHPFTSWTAPSFKRTPL